MSEEQIRKIGFEASSNLVDALQAARKAGRRYKDKGFSNRLAYEIGVKVLLEIEDEEEDEVLDQRLTDLDIQQSLIDNQRKLLIEKKEKRQAQKKKKKEEVLKSQQEIESLATKIIEQWESITVFKQKECIGFILNAFPGRLSRKNISAVFPDEAAASVPTYEEALRIATDLLRSGCNE